MGDIRIEDMTFNNDDKANQLNIHFTEIGHKIAKKISSRDRSKIRALVMIIFRLFLLSNARM